MRVGGAAVLRPDDVIHGIECLLVPCFVQEGAIFTVLPTGAPEVDPAPAASRRAPLCKDMIRCRDAARKAFFAEGEDRAKAIENLEAVLRVLENEIKGKRFFGGDGIGYTDLVVGWIAFWLGIAEDIACFKVVNAKKFPGIASWIDNFLEDPVINANLPPRNKAVEFFRNYRRLSLAASK